MFVLNCKITIGKYNFTSVYQVKITKSMHTFIDTAVIQIPTSALLKYKGFAPSESIIEPPVKQTGDLFKRGDLVVITLGYNGNMYREFTGFVKRVNFKTPLEIDCEGWVYPLRYITINKSFANTTVKELLRYITTGTAISLHPDIPDVPLKNVVFKNTSADLVLSWLHDKCLMAVFFNGSELYAGLEFLDFKGDVNYKLGWNTVKEDNLKYHISTDVSITIKGITVKDGYSYVNATVGDGGGQTQEVKLPFYTNDKDKMAAAKRKLQQYKYDGYEGKITAMLQPYAEHGYRAVITDDKYPERSGTYILESVEINFGTNGARRIVEVGIKLNP